MKYLINIILASAIIFVVYSIANQFGVFGTMNGNPAITTSELKERISRGDNPVILDVRQPEEYAEKNIPGSILIPLGELPNRLSELEQYKDKEIVVHCKSGGRSATAQKFLLEKGYNAVNLSGGILAW